VLASESSFLSTDALDLFERRWLPRGTPRGAVAIVHGYAEHSGRYGHVAERLVERGYAVFALDLRGHGRSPGARAVVRSFDEYVADVSAFLAGVRRRHAEVPVFLLGHSMGGLIVSLYLTEHGDFLRGAVLSGPAVRAEGNGPRVIEWLFRAIGRVLPNLRVATLDSTKVSRDPAEVAAYDADPLNYHGKMKAGLVAAFSKALRTLQKRAAGISIPIAIFHGSADGLADPEGSRVLHNRVSSADKMLRIYDGLYHEIFNEPERERVIGDVIAWLDERCPAVPGPVVQSSANRL
jgi:acylglycerol lipase